MEATMERTTENICGANTMELTMECHYETAMEHSCGQTLWSVLWNFTMELHYGTQALATYIELTVEFYHGHYGT